MSKLTLEDFVVLGRTVPEDSKKYGKKVCMAGYSPGISQFIRVYPLMLPIGENHHANKFKARHTYSLELRRPTDDTRAESWHVLDERNPTTTPWEKAVEVTTPRVIEWLNKRKLPSIKALNTCKQSLGVVFVAADKWEGFQIARDKKGPETVHASVFEDLTHQPDEVKQAKYAP